MTDQVRLHGKPICLAAAQDRDRHMGGSVPTRLSDGMMVREPRADPALKVVRLPDVMSEPCAVGSWVAEDVEPGKLFEPGSKPIHLKLV